MPHLTMIALRLLLHTQLCDTVGSAVCTSAIATMSLFKVDVSEYREISVCVSTVRV